MSLLIDACSLPKLSLLRTPTLPAGAYFCGKAFGRTQVRGVAAGQLRLLRLAPALCASKQPALRPQLTAVSPKKTVEGAVGGLLSSVAVALGLYKVCSMQDSSGHVAVRVGLSITCDLCCRLLAGQTTR